MTTTEPDDIVTLTYTDPQHRLGWLQCFATGDMLPGTDPGDPLNWALHNIAAELLAVRAMLRASSVDDMQIATAEERASVIDAYARGYIAMSDPTTELAEFVQIVCAELQALRDGKAK